MPSRQMNYTPRRRGRGVPVGLVIALIITALAIGGVVGYVIYRRGSGEADGTVNVFESMAPAQEESAQEASAPAEAEADITGEFVDQDEAEELLSGDNAAAPLNDPFEAPDAKVMADALASIEEPVVVAEYAGGKVMSNEVIDAYNEVVSAYLMAGFSVEDYAEELLEDVLYEEVCSRIARQEAEELGLTELTEADEAAIAEQAEAIFEELIAEHAGADADAAVREEAVRHLEENEGLTFEALKEMIAGEWWNEKLYQAVVADVEVTGEVLQQTYEELAAIQKDDFEQFPDDYEYARLNGELIAYNPEGYRMVQHLYIALDAEAFAGVEALKAELAGLNAEENAERVAEIGEELDKIYAPLEEKAQAALERIGEGEEFAALMAEIGEDEMMSEESAVSGGYYVCKDTVLWSEEFVAAAMALLKPGEVSDPFRGEDGVHIVFYAADVEPGNVPLDEIRDRLEAETLLLLQQDAYSLQMDLWLEEAGAVYYPERLR